MSENEYYTKDIDSEGNTIRRLKRKKVLKVKRNEDNDPLPAKAPLIETNTYTIELPPEVLK